MLAYCALQPVVATLLTVAIISSGLHTDLHMPRFPNWLGVFGVIVGLLLIVRDAQTSDARSAQAEVHCQDPFAQGNSIQRMSDPLVPSNVGPPAGAVA